MTQFIIGQTNLPADKELPSSKQEFDDVTQAAAVLMEAIAIEEAFDLFVASFSEFEAELLVKALHNLLYADYTWTASADQRQSYNRRLLNVLAAARLYLDHLRQRVNGIVPDDALAWGRIDAVRRSQYDNLLGYRVMEGIRNYIQHQNLPIESFSHHMYSVGPVDGSPRVRNTVQPYLDLNTLERTGGLKTAIVAELRTFGTRIALRPLLREYFTGLGTLHGEVRAALKPRIDAADNLMQSFFDRWAEAGHTDSLGLAVIRLGEHGEYTDNTPILKNGRERLHHLGRKNSRLGQFLNHYVSNEAWR